MKLREELQNASIEKSQLEEEIKARNQEMYQMNEKLIFLEYNKKAINQSSQE